MRRVLAATVAGLVSAGLSTAFVHGITNWTPCHGEGLACSMDGIAGLLATLVLAGLSAIVFAVALLWRSTTRSLDLALAVLALPVAFLLFTTLQHNSLMHDGLALFWRDVQQLLQLVVGPALGVLIPWALLRAVMTWREWLAPAREEAAPARD